MEYSTRIVILAPPQRVWQVLAEVDHWPEWTASVTRVARHDAAPLGIGSRVRIDQPKMRPAIWTVTKWRPGRCFSWVSRYPGVTVDAEHLIDATPAGSSVTLTLRIGGLFGPLAARVAGTRIEHYLALEAAGLKKRSEGAR